MTAPGREPEENLMESDTRVREATYSTGARHFHWWTVALLAVQMPVGLYMAYRGGVLNVWDGLTNALYSSHKTLGLVILALVLARLAYRLVHGAPGDEPTITWWQKAASHATHWSLYLLLIVVPVVGWLGISLYGARDVFGLFTIPALAPQNAETATRVLMLHKYLAYLTVALIAMHVGAAVVLHWLIRGDGVLARMLPWAGTRR
jgi:cytochrome b561